MNNRPFAGPSGLSAGSGSTQRQAAGRSPRALPLRVLLDGLEPDENREAFEPVPEVPKRRTAVHPVPVRVDEPDNLLGIN